MKGFTAVLILEQPGVEYSGPYKIKEVKLKSTTQLITKIAMKMKARTYGTNYSEVQKKPKTQTIDRGLKIYRQSPTHLQISKPSAQINMQLWQQAKKIGR